MEPGVHYVFPVWNEKGLFFEARSQSTKGVLEIEWLIDSKMDEINKIFPGCHISTKKISETSFILKIKIWDDSLSVFTNANTEDRKKYVMDIREKDSEYCEWINNWLYYERLSKKT